MIVDPPLEDAAPVAAALAFAAAAAAAPPFEAPAAP
jgi:hypothetical protein